MPSIESGFTPRTGPQFSSYLNPQGIIDVDKLEPLLQAQTAYGTQYGDRGVEPVYEHLAGLGRAGFDFGPAMQSPSWNLYKDYPAAFKGTKYDPNKIIQALQVMNQGVPDAVPWYDKYLETAALALPAFFAGGALLGAGGAATAGPELAWLSNAPAGSVFAQPAALTAAGVPVEGGLSSIVPGFAGEVATGSTAATPWLSNAPAGSVFSFPGATPGMEAATPSGFAGLDAAGIPLDTNFLSSLANDPTSLSSPSFSEFGAATPRSFGAITSGAGGSSSALGMEEILKRLKQMGLIPGGGPSSNAFSLGSGLYGLLKSDQMSKLAGQLANQRPPVMDPFGYGPQRSQYATQLAALMANPAAIGRYPGYQAGIDAVTRKMASQGYLGSGNMMAALQKYGGGFFNQESNRLAQLAGAQFAPSFGPSTAGPQLSGQIAANDLASRALASLGYGFRGLEAR